MSPTALVTVALVLGAVVLNTAAQFLLKAGAGHLSALAAQGHGPVQILLAGVLNLHILAGLSFYVLSFGIWIGVLARLQVSVAYPLLSLGYVFGAIAAYYLLGEPLGAAKIFGIGLILAGVVVVARS